MKIFFGFIPYLFGEKLKSDTGFTFIEVLLVIAVIGGLVGLAIPFYQSFQISSQLENITQEITQALRLAQARAMAAEDYSAFGLHLESQKFVLFKGDIYSESDAYNEPTKVPAVLSINSSLGSEVVFSRISGVPSAVGSIIISTNRGEANTITINDLGVVNVN